MHALLGRAILFTWTELSRVNFPLNAYTFAVRAICSRCSKRFLLVFCCRKLERSIWVDLRLNLSRCSKRLKPDLVRSRFSAFWGSKMLGIECLERIFKGGEHFSIKRVEQRSRMKMTIFGDTPKGVCSSFRSFSRRLWDLTGSLACSSYDKILMAFLLAVTSSHWLLVPAP